MQNDAPWYQEKWATDLIKDIAVGIFGPKPKEETEPFAPELAGGVTFGDWVIPVTVGVAIVLILLFVVFFGLRLGR